MSALEKTSSDTYKSISLPSQGSYKDNGSKFLAFAFPVETEAQIKEHVAALKKEYFDARHHCYAYRLGHTGEPWRANDDGEPSSSAGRPILGQLLSRELSDILVVVVRYFGGIIVSSLPTVFGEKFVIRILDKSTFHFTRADLGFTASENEVVDKMLARPHGIILLTGPTGCGKSTTLYSFLKEVNKPDVNIVTVEDPVEYTMKDVNQTQVNAKAEMTFATALRSILRQDPDIIMIGEIRDEETAEIAVRAAITGHIVFSTLHTNDAPGAILRLVDMGVEDYLVGDALVGVIAQRLVKKLCPACKKKGRATAEEMKILGATEPVSVWRPQGCQFCNNTGYKGRTAVHEVMYINDKMRAVLLQEKNLEVLRKKAVENGMTPLYETCKKLVLNGTTSIQELMSLNLE